MMAHSALTNYPVDRERLARRFDGIAVAALAITVLALFVALGALMLDDAFITYSFARNLARDGVFRYHADNPYLSTSAPFFGVLLALPGRLGLSIPAFSNALSAASIFGASLAIYLLFARHQARPGGVIAAALVATSPLLWLSLGLETCALVFLVCAACYFSDADRPALTGLFLGLAVSTRGDALIAAVVIALHQVFILRRRMAWQSLAAFLMVVVPFQLYLAATFGSPLPATLDAKQAQQALGISGFYVDTSLLEGLGILWRGWWHQTRLYVVIVPLLLLGLAALPKSLWAFAAAAWGVLHLAAYVLLGVTPYFWYYAPVVVTLAVTVGLGVQWLSARSPARVGAVTALAFGVLLLSAQIISLQRITAAISGPLPPKADPNNKVLPGSNGPIYRLVGEWLNANSPAGATVGVTEVGIIGFFADRAMIDFLGVLQPDVAQALQRRDLYYTLPHYLPDYLVLSSELATFGLPLADDPWFRSNYRPVQTLADPLGRDESLVVLERTSTPAAPIERRADIEVADAIAIPTYAVDEAALYPGGQVRVRLDLAKTDAEPHDVKTIVYFNGPDGSLAALGEREGNTRDWPEGQAFPSYHLVDLPEDLAPGRHQFGIRVIVDAGQTDEAQHLIQLEVGDRPGSQAPRSGRGCVSSAASSQ